MGLLSKIGNIIKQSIVTGLAQGLASATNTRFDGISNNSETYNLYADQNLSETFSAASTAYKNKASVTQYEVANRNTGLNKFLKAHQILTDSAQQKIIDTKNQENMKFKIPDWGYDDFINERALWQKSITSVLGDPTWFYFKIFFDFDTQYGLFGGLLNDEDYKSSTNAAAKYLASCSTAYYKQEKLNDRINALKKFTSILSYINCNSPWFFKSIKGLDKAGVPTTDNFSAEKSFEIELQPDAVDMRVSSLFDLYKYACYDDINCKEVIPENLRKFDMSIILFQMPIKYLHTAMKSNNGSFKYKTLGNPSSEYDNVMSFKMFSFTNCEIDINSLGSAVPGDITNEQPFQLGKNTVKIKYDRVYTHTMNEFNRFLFGSDGFYYQAYDMFSNSSIKDGDTQSKRYRDMRNALVMPTVNTSVNASSYKSLVDASEAVMHNNLIKFSGYSFGNLYSQDLTTGSDYYKAKLKWLHNRTPILEEYGTNKIISWIEKVMGTNTSVNSTQKLGSLYPDMNIGSSYYDNKLKRLKNRHEVTNNTPDTTSQYFINKLKNWKK